MSKECLEQLDHKHNYPKHTPGIAAQENQTIKLTTISDSAVNKQRSSTCMNRQTHRLNNRTCKFELRLYTVHTYSRGRGVTFRHSTMIHNYSSKQASLLKISASKIDSSISSVEVCIEKPSNNVYVNKNFQMIFRRTFVSILINTNTNLIY